MNKDRIEYLYRGYLSGSHSAEESIDWELLLLAKEETQKDLLESIDGDWDALQANDYLSLKANRSEEILNSIIGVGNIHKIKIWPRIIAIAAAIAIAVTGLVFFYPSLITNEQEDFADVSDIHPGKSGATLTLPGGKIITLSGSKNGVVVDPLAIRYNDGTELEKGVLNQGENSAIELTAATTNGQTYMITLPDETKVWLNSATKLTFPSTFKNLERREVSLSGEAYFIVEHDAKHPFIVHTGNQLIEDLGTAFNINSYPDDEEMKTTLINGIARVATLEAHLSNKYTEYQSVVLKPKQQAIVYGKSIKVKEVDLKTVVDWRAGKFVFNDEPLVNIMRRVSRWYNVTVEYRGIDPNQRFGGSVSRFENVSILLEKLEQTGGLHFKIEGRNIIVTK